MNGEQLKRAREIRGYTQTDLANDPDIDVSQAAIARIEQNLLEPSDDLIDRLARKLDFPVGFFHEPNSFDFPQGSFLFRCLKALRSKKRTQITQTAWAGFKMYDSMAKRLNVKPSTFPRLTDHGIFSTTQILRSALGIESDKPIRNLVNLLERAGVVIIAIPLDIHEHDGFSVWIKDRPVIVLSAGKPGDRQRRTLTHESIHLAIHHTVAGDLDQIEKQANEYTNEMLGPGDVMYNEIQIPVTLSSLAELKPRWGVSIQSLIERSYELNIITPNQRTYLWKQVSMNGWRREEPYPIKNERPRALQYMAELLYGETGRVNYDDLASDVNLPIDLVRGILSAYEGYKFEDAGNVVDISMRFAVDDFPPVECIIPDPTKVTKFPGV